MSMPAMPATTAPPAPRYFLPAAPAKVETGTLLSLETLLVEEALPCGFVVIEAEALEPATDDAVTVTRTGIELVPPQDWPDGY